MDALSPLSSVLFAVKMWYNKNSNSTWGVPEVTVDLYECINLAQLSSNS